MQIHTYRHTHIDIYIYTHINICRDSSTCYMSDLCFLHVHGRMNNPDVPQALNLLRHSVKLYTSQLDIEKRGEPQYEHQNAIVAKILVVGIPGKG